MKFLNIVTAALLIGYPATCYAMDANTFYIKAAALNKKGMAAMLSSDLRPIMAEVETASKATKAENEKAKVAGKPLYCPPPKGKFSSDQMLAEFGRIPAERRKIMTTRQAWREILIRRFPC